MANLRNLVNRRLEYARKPCVRLFPNSVAPPIGIDRDVQWRS
ncbi:hypothetical protein CFBP3840_P200005 (plasmid) [Pseudomonas syringae]|uniref:Uncharacterized protein n=1 Tax=Pseudomonas syringae TaxID=317 RepID=A0A2K4X3G2_PSESX|nr:hypothetical protein CFBP3840_P200005 [Pseudomonas syringae]